MTLEDKQIMFDKQEGRCKLCTSVIASLSLAHVDHSHVTDTIRGLLCQRCNGFVLAMIEKLGLEGIKRAIEYLIAANEPGWVQL
jgi:hypothetical protein